MRMKHLTAIAWFIGNLAGAAAGAAPDTAEAMKEKMPSEKDGALTGIMFTDTATQTQPQTQAGFAGPADNPYLRESEDPSWFRQFILSPTKISSQYEMSYNVASPEGVSNNRTSLRLEYSKFFLDHFYLRTDAKLSAFLPEDHRTRSTTLWINDESSRAEISLAAIAREAYLQVSLGTWSLKAGIQVPAWGEFEFVTVTDELSPQDYREPLVVSLDELRLGQAMVILDQYSALGTISGFVVPYPLFNEHPEVGNRYFSDPFPGSYPVSAWDRDPGEMEYGLRWKNNFDKTDVSLVAARLLENEQYAFMTESGNIQKGAQPFFLAGASIDHALKKILLKAEVAAKLPRAFVDDSLAKVERNVLDAALGLTYTWSSSTTLTFESANSHIVNWSSRLQGVPQDSYTLVGMLRRQFLNDDLALTWITMYTGPYTSYFHILSATYLWNDRITLSGELLLPVPDNSQSYTWQLRDQKQIALRIKDQF